MRTVVVGVGVALGQVLLGFYGFWLVWRVLAPWLPGPPDLEDRVAPFARWFTAPFVDRPARRMRVRAEVVAAAALVVVAAGLWGLGTVG